MDKAEYLVLPWSPPQTTTADLNALISEFQSQLHSKKYQNICALLAQLGSRACLDANWLLSGGTSPSASGDTGSLGSPLNLGHAIANFLYERARSEFKAFLLDRVVRQICDPWEQPNDTLFPRVCTNATKNDANTLLRMQAGLGRAARQDLIELPAYLIWQASPSADRHTWGYVLTNFALQHRYERSTRALLAGLAENPSTREECLDPKKNRCAIYYLGLMAQVFELTRQSKKQPADQAKDFAIFALWSMHKNLCAEKACVDAAKAESWLVKADSLAAVLLQAMGAGADKLAERIQAVQTKANALEAEVQRLKALANSGAPEERVSESVRRVVQLGVDLAEELFGVAGKLEDGFLQTTGWQGYVALYRSVGQVYAAFESGRYSEGTWQLLTLLECFETEQKARTQCGAPLPFYADAKLALKVDSDAVKNIVLIAAIADAKTNAEAQALLDQWASPLGSWRFKRERPMLSLGSIVGGAAGKEYLRGPGVDSYDGSFTSVFAPIGFDYSTRCTGYWYALIFCLGSQSSTVGIFISLLDFGNLVSARMSGDTSEDVSKTSTDTKLRDIASPGIFARWGVQRTPWVLFVGVAWTPGLRTGTLNSGQEVDLLSRRVMIGAGMDIPLFFF